MNSHKRRLSSTAPGARAPAHEQLETGDAEGVLDVDGDEADPRAGPRRPAGCRAAAPTGRLRRPLLIGHAPDLADTRGSEVGRDGQLAHGRLTHGRPCSGRAWQPCRIWMAPDRTHPERVLTHQAQAQAVIRSCDAARFRRGLPSSRTMDQVRVRGRSRGPAMGATPDRAAAGRASDPAHAVSHGRSRGRPGDHQLPRRATSVPHAAPAARSADRSGWSMRPIDWRAGSSSADGPVLAFVDASAGNAAGRRSRWCRSWRWLEDEPDVTILCKDCVNGFVGAHRGGPPRHARHLAQPRGRLGERAPAADRAGRRLPHRRLRHGVRAHHAVGARTTA